MWFLASRILRDLRHAGFADDEAQAVRDVLTSAMGEPTPGDTATARAFAPLEDPAGVRLLPLDRYREVPISG